MIELYDFQQGSADEMAKRVVDYIDDPSYVGRGDKRRQVPFVQFLSSITASGKTVVLADAVAQIAMLSPIKPVVIWMSKLTVVVGQSYASLAVGGKYNDLIQSFEVRPFGGLSLDELQSTDKPFLYFSTTGTFNIGTKEGRKVFDAQIDKGNHSVWEGLRLRLDPQNRRRPLVVVYDEAHNLSEQQTTLLLEQEPSAFLLSTATARVPQVFDDNVTKPLRAVGQFEEDELRSNIDASKVAGSGLVKKSVDLVGRQSPMEDVVSEMFEELQKTRADAVTNNLSGVPKAVYICRTNITEGDDRRRDNPEQPFQQRQAPPILIWRHLVEGLKVDPATIAVYCDLKVDKKHPLPNDFTLLKGSEKDYNTLVEGNYEHIIFNQSLEEGWDDPLVYFAYIDKTLGSTIAAEQIVGRLLRQPGRTHYVHDRLNAAQLFIRVESNKVFDDVVKKTQQRLEGEAVPISVSKTRPGAANRRTLAPKEVRTVPDVATHTESAVDEMTEIVGEVPDYKNSVDVTTGKGRRAKVQTLVGGKEHGTWSWEEIGTSTRVSARWLFNRALRRYHKDAASLVMLNEAKWDAMIGVGSAAATALDNYAQRVGSAFMNESYIEVADLDDEDFIVGDALVNEDHYESFEHALHEGYSGLNDSLESPFAQELDKLKFPWSRNPSQSGYGIPLIKQGGNDTFFPDFLAWAHKDVYAIDTKGSHIMAGEMHKLVRLRWAPGRPKIHIRFVVNGHLDPSGQQTDKGGFTVIGFKPDGDVLFTPVVDLSAAAKAATKKSG